MEQVLRLKWPRCPDGYDLIQFDPRKVDWERYHSDENPNQPQLTSDEQRFLATWGEQLTTFERGDETEQWFLARTKRIIKPNIMAKEPRLFLEFAETRSDVKKQRKFVDDYGLLWNGSPCALTTVSLWASTMDKLIKRRESERRRNETSWLKEVMKNFDSGLGSDVHIHPDVHNGDVRLILKPNDLRIAMLIQLMFSRSNNITVTYCAYCDNLMPKGPQLNRIDRKFCSNSCRQRDYRRRKQW